jgi:mRNA interferase MazF
MIYEPFEVVEVPFPFSDIKKTKIRKALVLSAKSYSKENGVTTLIMITSANFSQWKGDVHLANWMEAGLKKPCFARMKFFSVDNEMIISRVGRLSSKDRLSVSRVVADHFNMR